MKKSKSKIKWYLQEEGSKWKEPQVILLAIALIVSAIALIVSIGFNYSMYHETKQNNINTIKIAENAEEIAKEAIEEAKKANIIATYSPDRARLKMEQLNEYLEEQETALRDGKCDHIINITKAEIFRNDAQEILITSNLTSSEIIEFEEKIREGYDFGKCVRKESTLTSGRIEGKFGGILYANGLIVIIISLIILIIFIHQRD